MSASSALRTLTLTALLAAGAGAGAQDAPEGPPEATEQQVADLVQAWYDQTRTMTASFVQRYRNPTYDRTVTSRGQIRVQRPGRMRMDYAEPNGQVVVTDGQRVLSYEPPEPGERRGQYFERRVEEDQLPSALAFLTGSGRLADFRPRLLSSADRGFSGWVLELRPRTPSPHYERIVLYVDARERFRGVVRRVVVIDADGNSNRYDFTGQRFNAAVADDVFAYRPPGDARRIDP
jgi:outer membrane lipoprotein carrier protein